LFRTLANGTGIEVVDRTTGAVKSVIRSLRPDQIAAAIVQGRIVLVWTAGQLIDLDGGDYFEGPAEARTERYLETVVLDKDGSPQAVTKLFADGTLYATSEEEAREGEGASILRTHVEHPESTSRIAVGAVGIPDVVQDGPRQSVFYWGAQSVALRVSKEPDASSDRLPLLDHARILGALGERRYVALSAVEGSATSTRFDVRVVMCP
jgi:hypothetical protein